MIDQTKKPLCTDFEQRLGFLNSRKEKGQKTMTETKNSNPFFMHNVSSSTDWAKYLDDLDRFLKAKGFRKYNQNHKREDFAYWKQYDEKYQIGLLIYDWRKYPQHAFDEKKVSIAFECMPLEIDGRCDLCVSKDIELPEFEEMAKTFYDAMIDYCH